MNQLKEILKPFASLRLTVVLLALCMIVVFAGTWAQIDEGIWQVQRKYFHSLAFVLDFNIFLPRSQPDLSGFPAPVAGFTKMLIAGAARIRMPMLGGYSLIFLLLVNLLAAHTLRFKLNAKRSGILLIHAGLILMISGEVITSLFAVESQMVIDEGQTVNFASDVRSVELAVVDPSSPDHDTQVIIPGKRLARKDTISYPELPFSIRVDSFMPNSMVLGPFQAKGQEDARATAGAGVGLTVKETAKFSGTEAESVDKPSAYVTLIAGGQNLGTYLVSLFLEPQDVTIGAKTYRMQLRFTRYYKDYSVKLIDFAFDRYTGTNTPKNFSSLVRLTDPKNETDREVKIWMNHPLRYAGETFYQQNFDDKTERTTILQVVRNPAWVLPYVSCVMVGLGMLIHFGMNLMEFFRKRSVQPVQANTKGKAPSRQSPGIVMPGLARARPGLLWPVIITCACVVYLFSLGAPKKSEGKFDLAAFGRVPVSYEGRVMPMDSLARNSLRMLSGKSTLFIEDKSRETWFHRMFQIPAGETKPATLWLVTTLANPEESENYRVVRIDHPQIISQLGLDPKRTRFSVKEIMEKRKVIEEQAQLAHHVTEKKRDLYQKKFLELVERLNLFYKLANPDGLYLAPPAEAAGEWKTVNDVMESAKGDETKINPGLRSVLGMLRAFHSDDNSDSPALFASAGNDYANWLDVRLPLTSSRLNAEMIMNNIDPFYAVTVLSVLIFLLCCLSWLGWTATLQRAAFWVLLVTVIFHTLALVARIYIQGRPPITNLYSTAIFIGWAIGVMCLGLELIYRNGIGTAMAAVTGFISSILAINIAGTSENGDTMHMMRAVLDTNLWLATHVVIINLGYAATFLAGFLAIAYIILGVFSSLLSENGSKTVYRMVYGILCFAMLFSFVGTVLGGIWADQSWGRFWGWDPKENGAVLIVFWNALILHARWGGLVQARGVMNLAIFGNAVTGWSYFGTNMLGVGLHSYGFMDSAVFWLVLFVLIQLAFIGIGSLPLRFWRSFAAKSEANGVQLPSGAQATA